MNGWIAVDLDGTLAHYDGWKGAAHIGEPVPLMLERVKKWLAEGKDVRIFTARVSLGDPERDAAIIAIRLWCLIHLDQELIATAEKDFGMIELWDDRCVQVEPNTGMSLAEIYANGISGVNAHIKEVIAGLEGEGLLALE